MMRNFLFITLISFVVGINVPLDKKAATVSEVIQFPLRSSLGRQQALGLNRRRPSGSMSFECYRDIFSDGIWCISADISCDVLGNDHTKWVIQIDHDTEYICYPSSCSATDLETYWTMEMEIRNASARYCSLECPAIEFDISGTSEDGQTMSINGKYHYADLSYECAGAAAATEISRCDVTDSCPNHVDGVTTCSFNFEDRLSYAHLNQTWKSSSQACFPDECTDESNLEKLEDFEYAFLTFLEEQQYGIYFTPEEIREGYLVDWSCPTSPVPTSEPTTPVPTTEPTTPVPTTAAPTSEVSHTYSKYVSIFGVIAALLFVLCLGAICYLRICRGGGVVMTPIIGLELNNREAFEAVEAVMCNPLPRDRVEGSIVEVDSPRASSSNYALPIQTNQRTANGELDHA